jgi:hypothetical protein
MFEQYSYLGYTLLFCLPPIVLLWVRAEFARAMREDLRGILLSTAIISLYGSAIWPVAIRLGCWSYREDRILNRKLFGVVYVEDVVWWVLVSFLFASFVALSTRWERSGRDVVVEELSGLLRAFRDAFAGFRAAGPGAEHGDPHGRADGDAGGGMAVSPVADRVAVCDSRRRGSDGRRTAELCRGEARAEPEPTVEQ